MRTSLAAAASLIVFTFAACGENPTAPPDPSFAISDGAHAGNAHFYFLPPMVPNPSLGGTFDGSLSPEVQVCAWDGTVCAATLAIFNVNAGSGSETVRVSTDHYIVNWHTEEIVDNHTLGPGETFRIRVIVQGQELGFADLAVVGSAKELKNVNTDELVPLLDGRTLPIKFRIEEGAVMPPFLVSISPSSGTVGTEVVITGQNMIQFGLQPELSLNGVPVSPVFVTAAATQTEMIFLAPNAGGAGTYSLSALFGDQSTDALVWEQIGDDEPSEPDNDDPATAPTITLPTDLVGSFHDGDVDDFYALTLSTPTRLHFELDWNDPALDVDILVTDVGITTFECNFAGATLAKPQAFSCDLDAGDHLLFVNKCCGSVPGNPALVSYRLVVTE